MKPTMEIHKNWLSSFVIFDRSMVLSNIIHTWTLWLFDQIIEVYWLFFRSIFYCLVKYPFRKKPP